MRRLVVFALVFAPLAACQSAQVLEEGNKAVARRAFEEILSQGHFESAEELYARDFVNHGLHRDIGLKEDQDAAKGWRSAFPDARMEVQEVVAEGDRVAVLWVGRGTNTGTGNGLPATGKTAELRGITIWRIVDGRIKEEWSAYNELSLMQQLGLMPPAGQ